MSIVTRDYQGHAIAYYADHVANDWRAVLGLEGRSKGDKGATP